MAGPGRGPGKRRSGNRKAAGQAKPAAVTTRATAPYRSREPAAGARADRQASTSARPTMAPMTTTTSSSKRSGTPDMDGAGGTPSSWATRPQRLGLAVAPRSSWVSTTWRKNPAGAIATNGAQTRAKPAAAPAKHRPACRPPARPGRGPRAICPSSTRNGSTAKALQAPATPKAAPANSARRRLLVSWPLSKAASSPIRHHRSQ